jgi:hypothetical protein
MPGKSGDVTTGILYRSLGKVLQSLTFCFQRNGNFLFLQSIVIMNLHAISDDRCRF